MGRFLAAFHMFWTTTVIHHRKEVFLRYWFSFDESSLSVPDLPQHYPKTVDVCFAVIHLGFEHFWCHVGGASSKGTSNVYCFFRCANVSNFYCVIHWQLQNKKITVMFQVKTRLRYGNGLAAAQWETQHLLIKWQGCLMMLRWTENFIPSSFE